MKTTSGLLRFCAGSLLLAFAATALAQQSYPSRPIRLVIPFPPGGGADFVGRVVGRRLGEQVGQNIIVDNRGGASGTIATELVAKATPDGYTLLVGEVTSLVITPLYEKAVMDRLHDLAIVSLLGSVYHVLVIHPSVGAKSVKDLVSLAKARPGQINFATSGGTSSFFLMGEILKAAAGFDMTHVPYKGIGPATLALLGGEAQAMFAAITSVDAHVRSGRLIALAVTSPKRSPVLPDVPTFVESGLQGIEVAGWFWLVAPAGTPRKIIMSLNAEVAKFNAAGDYRQYVATQAFEPRTTTPEEGFALWKAELEKYGKVVKATRIKPS